MGSVTLTRSDDPEYEEWGLVDSIEHSFNVHFWPRELKSATTVQALHDIMIDKLGKEAPERCLCAVTFYRLRRAMMEFCHVPRSAVTPRARMRDILPIRNRRFHWDLLSSVINREMPPLRYPKGVVPAVTLAIFGMVIVFARILNAGQLIDMGSLWTPRYLHFSYGPSWGNWFQAAVCGFAMWSILVGFVLKPLEIRFPRGCETVGEYVKTAVAFNFGKAAKVSGGWNERELMYSLRMVLAYQTGCPIDQIRPETSLTTAGSHSQRFPDCGSFH